MKLHESNVICVRTLSSSCSSFVLDKILIHEDEHEYEYEKYRIRSLANVLTPHMKLHGSQCHFHEIGGHSPPYGALKTTWRNVGWAAPTMIATGRSRPAAVLI